MSLLFVVVCGLLFVIVFVVAYGLFLYCCMVVVFVVFGDCCYLLCVVCYVLRFLLSLVGCWSVVASFLVYFVGCLLTVHRCWLSVVWYL